MLGTVPAVTDSLAAVDVTVPALLVTTTSNVLPLSVLSNDGVV